MLNKNEELVSKLKRIRNEIDTILEELCNESYEDLVKSLLYGTDSEFLAPYLVRLNLVESTDGLRKIAKSHNAAKANWLISNKIEPFIDMSPEDHLLLCPLPTHEINGVYNETCFHNLCVSQLFNYIISADPNALEIFSEKIKSVLFSESLKQKYKINKHAAENFNIKDHHKLQRALIAQYYGNKQSKNHS